ncbi:MAG: LamG-like jellyroll fold domain-containing protein [Verrucomicrobiota bacterium]
MAATLHAGVLVNLDATSLPAGPITSWTNAGSLGGSFTSDGAAEVAAINGVKAVNLTGDYFVGPPAPASVTGVNPNRSVEVWAYNAELTGEETMVAWGRRGGGDGTNMSFNYSTDAGYGAAGQWGAVPDIGWNGAPAAGVWHHLVYTYDGGGAAGAGTCRVYADGVLKNSEFQGVLNTYGPPLPFILGGQNDANSLPQVFNTGLTIARVRVHDTVLGMEQIQDAYAAELPTFRPGETFVPGPYVASSRLIAPSTFEFKVNDRVSAPASIVVPATFTVRSGPGPVKWQFVTGARNVWNVLGGEANVFGGLTTPEKTVPGAGPLELTLTHRYNFEGDLYDGGIVEVSINGAPFKVLPAASFTQNGYGEGLLIGNGYTHGQRAWGGPSEGFDTGTLITSVATIPGAAAGDKVRVRFMGAWDDGYTPDGIDWEIAGVKLTAGAAVMMDENFSTGDGGFTTFSSNEPASMGALTAAKVGPVTTFTFPADWVQRGNFAFVLSGKDEAGHDLSFPASFAVPGQRLSASREWPASIPGPAGAAGTWGLRTYLNEGLDTSDNITAMMSFLAGAAGRTPALTPATVFDTQETDLSFRDPESTAAAEGPHGALRTFPGDTPADDNHVISSAHGAIRITEESDYTFSLRGDDGFFFRITAASGVTPGFITVGGDGIIDPIQRNVLFHPNGTGDANTRGIIRLTPGVYRLEYAHFEGTGGFFYQVAAAKGAFLNQTDTTAWRTIGYIPPPPPSISMGGDWTVLSSAATGLTQVNMAGANAAVDAAVAANAAAATSQWPQINFFDPQSGGTGRIIGDEPWPRNTAADDDRYAMRMTGTLRITAAGSYLIGYQGDDGGKLTVGGVNAGFTELTENATGAGVIGTGNTVMANSGSTGAAGNSTPDTAVTLQQVGAIAGDADKSIAVGVVGAPVSAVTIPFNAAFNPKTPTGGTAPFSVEAWVKPDSLAGGAQSVINSMIAGNQQNPTSANDRSGYVLRMNNDSWQFYLGKDGPGGDTTNFYDILDAPGTVKEAQWQHVAGVFDGTKSYLYVNGVEVANQQVSLVSGPVKANYAAPVILGDRGFAGWLLKGGLDEAAIYNGVLTPAVILSHYENGINSGRSTAYSALVLASSPTGYWRLGETLAPRVNLGTMTTDFATGDSSTVGRIFLNPGDYPITATFWEDAGGSYFEVFAAPDDGSAFKALSRPPGSPGLALVPGTTATPTAPVILGGGLTLNANKTLSLSFASIAGNTYALEVSTDLITWQEISTLVANGTTGGFDGAPGGAFVYDPAKPRRYYRLRAK